MVGGIVSVIVAVVLVLVYLLATRLGEENSKAARIVCWLGMVFGVAGGALMTLEYSFPQISHPEWYILDHFVEYYGDSYKKYISVEVDVYLGIYHEELDTKEEDGTYMTYFKTDVLYASDETVYNLTLLNKYEYTSDYSYQNVVTYPVEKSL